MLIANAQRAVLAELVLDLKAALLGVGVLHVRVHGAEVKQHAGRKVRLLRMFGKTGAPACAGERLMLTWLRSFDIDRVARRQQRIGQRHAGVRGHRTAHSRREAPSCAKRTASRRTRRAAKHYSCPW